MRKKFFIKPKLQLNHLAWTLGIVTVCSFLGYIVFETIVSSALGSAQSSLQWAEIRSILRMGFGVVLLILLAAIGIENYLLFHSIVGPIFALERGLRRMSQGLFDPEIRVRETDQLKELIQAFEDMKKSVMKKMAVQEETVRVLEAEIDAVLKDASVQNLSVLRQKLKEIRKQSEKKAA